MFFGVVQTISKKKAVLVKKEDVYFVIYKYNTIFVLHKKKFKTPYSIFINYWKRYDKMSVQYFFDESD